MAKSVAQLKAALESCKDVERTGILVDLATALLNAAKYDEARRYTDEALALSRRSGDRAGEARALRSLGFCNSRRGNYRQAIRCFSDARAIYEELSDSEGVAKCINCLGTEHYRLGDYDQSLAFFLQALKEYEDRKDAKGVSGVHTNIGVIHEKLGEFEKALTYYDTALAVMEKHVSDREAAATLTNIGNVYTSTRSFEKALDCHFRALALKEKLANPALVADSLLNIGELYCKKGDYERALEYGHKALKIAEEINEPETLCYVLHNLGVAHKHLGHFDKAIARLEKSLRIARDLKAKYPQQENYRRLSEVHAERGDYKRALEYHMQSTQVERRLINEEKNKTISELQVRYETDRKDHEAEVYRLKTVALEKARKSADAANVAKSAFLANISHEIRTPMSGVITMADLMLETGMTEEQHEYLTIIKNSSNTLLRILNDLHDFSKIEAGKLELVSRPVILRDCLADTLSSFRLHAARKGVELMFHVCADVPRAAIGDPDRMRQIMSNLVANAIKFTERGEVVVRLEMEAEREGEVCLHYSVTDTGIGIPKKKLKDIFDPFAQIDSSKRRAYAGTGLGLAIASQLVELMGGRIWVDSEVGSGSAFHCTVWLGAVAQSPDTEEQEALDALRGLSVLVVEDNATGQRILEEQLEQSGMKPVIVPDGETALAVLRRACQANEDIPLVILDCRDAATVGNTIVNEIKQTSELSDVSIIALSSPIRCDNVACKRDGVRACLTKPVRQSAIVKALAAALKPVEETGDTVLPTPRQELEFQGRRPRILLVEDNKVNQRIMALILGKRRYRVETAKNGREAVEKCETGDFDLVLMDVQMPQMDGIEAARRIRSREKNTSRRIPIIAMTAYAMEGDRDACLAAGMDEYVSKPVKKDELYRKIEQFISRVEYHEEEEEEQVVRKPALGACEEIFDRIEALALIGNNEKTLEQVITLFLTEATELMEAMRAGMADSDSERVMHAAHTLKGAAGNLAAGTVHIAALALEEAARSRDTKMMTSALEELEHEMIRLVDLLEAS